MKSHTYRISGVTLEFQTLDKPGNIRRDGRAVTREIVAEINRVLATAMLENDPKLILSGGKIEVQSHEL
jgi:hypothetical protein